MVELVLSSTNIPNTTRFVSWTTSTTKDLKSSMSSLSSPTATRATHLEDIENREVHEVPLSSIVHLGSLDYYCVRWQVDTPGQCRGTYQDLQGYYVSML